MKQLRDALNEALSDIFGGPITFTYPATANSPVRALDVNEIRDSVK